MGLHTLDGHNYFNGHAQLVFTGLEYLLDIKAGSHIMIFNTR